MEYKRYEKARLNRQRHAKIKMAAIAVRTILIIVLICTIVAVKF